MYTVSWWWEGRRLTLTYARTLLIAWSAGRGLLRNSPRPRSVAMQAASLGGRSRNRSCSSPEIDATAAGNCRIRLELAAASSSGSCATRGMRSPRSAILSLGCVTEVELASWVQKAARVALMALTGTRPTPSDRARRMPSESSHYQTHIYT